MFYRIMSFKIIRLVIPSRNLSFQEWIFPSVSIEWHPYLEVHSAFLIHWFGFHWSIRRVLPFRSVISSHLQVLCIWAKRNWQVSHSKSRYGYSIVYGDWLVPGCLTSWNSSIGIFRNYSVRLICMICQWLTTWPVPLPSMWLHNVDTCQNVSTVQW